MIGSFLMGAWLAIAFPRPALLQAAIDTSRIIGLPRLRTMDDDITKTTKVDEMHAVPAFKNGSRKEFFIRYFEIGNKHGAH